MALAHLTPPPHCSRHPKKGESVGTLPLAQLQRSGTGQAETEQPLLREQPPLEVHKPEGAKQASGGAKGAAGGRIRGRWVQPG